MIEPHSEYITPDEAAKRLGKSAAQVRRDVRSQKLNSIREGVRIWVRVDERFRTLERDPSVRFPAEPGSVPTNVLDTSGPDHREHVMESKGPGLISDELIDEVADLRADVARLTARIRKLEARG